jgi:hypothetical protein
MQPVYKDANGEARFKQNDIVRKLLDNSQRLGFGLNELAGHEFSQADWEQFYQLIGYSVSGYHELSQVSDESAKDASFRAHALDLEGGCRDIGCEIHCGVAKELEA